MALIKEFKINNETNSIFLNDKFIENSWKQRSIMWGDPLHKTCAYNAMFPIRVADFFIKKYTNKKDIVLDPFSGRGTTLLQARILNRISYASDLNPLSYVLSKSKEKNLDLEKIINRVNELKKKYYLVNDKEKYLKKINNLETMQIYYSDYNLKQISFLKEKIGKKWKKNSDIDNFILAISLGLMHGPAKKNGDSSYFSLSMSNNLSMSPNYVKKYALKNNLVKPENDIFDLISTKIKKIYQKRTKELNNTKFDGYFKISNALNISKTWNDITPKLIFTSPPYLNIINYTKQNWIKMWMLGYETELDNKKIGLDDFHNINNYLNNFLIKFMKECHQIMNDKSKLIMVIGDVNRNNKVFSIYDHISLIEKETNLILKEIYIDEINQNSKATNSFGSKAGKATQVEKIYVFKKNKYLYKK